MGDWHSIVLEVTSACNLKCKGCVFTMQYGRRESVAMPVQDACQYLQSIADSGLFREVALFGYGEPMLHPAIATIVAKATGLKLISYISTNGNYECSNPPLFDAGLGRFLFSIDGFTQVTYEKFRRGGRIELALKNLVEVDSLNQQRGFPMLVEYQIVGFKHITNEEVDRARTFCKALHRVHFRCKSTLSRGAKPEKDRRKLIASGKVDPWGTCNTPMVRFDGSVGLCCRDWDTSRKLGSLKEAPLVEILAPHPRKYDSGHEVCVRKCPHLKEYSLL